MSRPLRWTEPGLLHHVMNRGLAGIEIFHDDDDREVFLELLSECGPRWDVWAHTYCLMGNHYHLVLKDEGGRLSRAMRHLDGVYTQRFNRREARDGPLMRGRFKSRVVQEERYLQELVRYLHVNPVEAGIVARAADYRWSSHRVYMGLDRREWLQTGLVGDLLGLDAPGQLQWFDDWVHDRIDPELLSELSPERWSFALGDPSFLEQAREAVRGRPELHCSEVGEGARLAALEVSEVLETACDVFEVRLDDLVRGTRGSRNLPRLLALLACRDLTAARTREIGGYFGVRGVTVSALSSRARGIVAEERGARESWERLVERLRTVYGHART